ncbi:MAG: hypothetical protein CVT88_09170 [Candidatus Altiarchaeales archaeon HGW-Altiarchaeales-1]|nr:MAG: hypothetical protein CVT89_07305 [Candidatus Altiarchaeales archaeon HGW-Altiarchaeales-2]PKP57230.1 MAG: hypothetical protein CVT88_09170 [Candidatus Altiarchaeales archaeon HGW-Altiarchaeales-1]
MENLTLDHIYKALDHMHKDIGEIKFELKRLSFIIEDDFELSESTKKDLEKARKEPLSSYIDHEEVLKEFL